MIKGLLMDKLQLTGQNLRRVFNSRSGCMCAMHLCCYEVKQPNLMLQPRPKQLLGYLPIAFALSCLLPSPAQAKSGVNKRLQIWTNLS
jgi:hypothetical protein